jgi:hypothetical protein
VSCAATGQVADVHVREAENARVMGHLDNGYSVQQARFVRQLPATPACAGNDPRSRMPLRGIVIARLARVAG